MKKLYLIIFLVCFGILSSLSHAYAAMYIKFDGIDGEAQDKDHRYWSDVMTCDWQVSTSATSSDATRTRGDTIVRPIIITKKIDKASPKICEALLKGKIFPKVEIHLTASYTDAGRVTYLAIELTNAQITNWSEAMTGQSEDVPVQSMAIAFEEIKYTYTEVDAAGMKKGNIEFSYKVESTSY